MARPTVAGAVLGLAAMAGCGGPSAGACQEAVGAVQLFIEEARGLEELIDQAQEQGDEGLVTALRQQRDQIGHEVALVVDERPSCFEPEMRDIAEVLLRNDE